MGSTSLERVTDGATSRTWSHGVDRWTLTPVVVGAVFAAVQAVHVVRMIEYGLLGVVLEAVVPMMLAVALGVTGPWLARRGYTTGERRRVVGWMAVIGVLVGLLFGWALTHQEIVGYRPFRHARFVTTTNLIAGSLLGLFVGVYDVQSRRHRRAVEAERETVARQRARLSVLNRVLRHNLRNEAAVVIGLTENLAERTSGETAEMAETAASKTGDLVALGEKARKLEEMTDVDGAAVEEVGLAATVRTVLDAHGRDDGVEFTVDVPTELQLRTAPRVLSSVLAELVENAVEHADADRVAVHVAASVVDGDRVEIVVADDGPGIPAHELDTLDSGVETALDHGSGLGLRLVTWGVGALGGEVSFDERAGGGTEVRISLPREIPVPRRSASGPTGPAPDAVAGR